MKRRLKLKAEEQKPKPKDAAVDPVQEASEKSFPASDAPSWTAQTGEGGGASKPDPAQANPAKGCAPSFIMEKRGEIGVCGEPQPDPKEEFVLPDKEKEAGGEGGGCG